MTLARPRALQPRRSLREITQELRSLGRGAGVRTATAPGGSVVRRLGRAGRGFVIGGPDLRDPRSSGRRSASPPRSRRTPASIAAENELQAATRPQVTRARSTATGRPTRGVSLCGPSARTLETVLCRLARRHDASSTRRARSTTSMLEGEEDEKQPRSTDLTKRVYVRSATSQRRADPAGQPASPARGCAPMRTSSSSRFNRLPRRRPSRRASRTAYRHGRGRGVAGGDRGARGPAGATH
jgi:hypothetical protein